MSISKSKLFKELLIEHSQDKSAADNIITHITAHENDIQKRVPLQEITTGNYNRCLNDSIDFIEKSNKISAWVCNLRLLILKKKMEKSRELDKATIYENKRLEQSDILLSITNKTEKEKQKKFLLDDKLLLLRAELDNLKFQLETLDQFCSQAESIKDLVYSYYQGIKNMQLQR